MDYFTSRVIGIGFLILLYGCCLLSLFGLYQYQVLGEKLNNAEAEEGGLEEKLTASFPIRYSLIELNGMFRWGLGQREMNDVVRLNNNFLSPVTPPLEPELIREEAGTIGDISDALKALDIPFIFIAPAARIQCDTDFPPGYESFENINYEIFMQELKAREVRILDLEEEFKKDGIKREEHYYSTDHHWNQRAALYCTEKLGKLLSHVTDTPFSPEALKEEDFEDRLYPRVMIGSLAQRTGAVFAGGLEDFSVCMPKEPRHLRELVSGQSGDIPELFYDLSRVEEKSYVTTAYESVYGKDGARAYVNDDLEEGLVILFLADSFGYPMEPFLTQYAKALHIGSSYSMESISRKVLEEIKPDAVVVLKYAPFHLGHPEYFRMDESLKEVITE